MGVVGAHQKKHPVDAAVLVASADREPETRDGGIYTRTIKRGIDTSGQHLLLVCSPPAQLNI